jgi:tRNA(fMet)-specific endonuclease VapC
VGRLILDTGVLIEVERGRLSLGDFGDNDDLAIAAVTIAEMKMGIALGDEAHRSPRQHFLEGLRKVLPVEDYTPEVADHHSELMVFARRRGRTRGPHDLIIAATARRTRRTLMTTDKSARFDDLPGIDCIELKP